MNLTPIVKMKICKHLLICLHTTLSNIVKQKKFENTLKLLNARGPNTNNPAVSTRIFQQVEINHTINIPICIVKCETHWAQLQRFIK